VEVFPIGQGTVVWTEFTSIVREYTGLKINKSIDASQLILSDYEKFLRAIGQFSARADSSALVHLYFSFIIICTNRQALDLAESSNLAITSTKAGRRRLLYCSGNLITWIDVITKFPDLGKELTEIFCRNGLKSVFRERKLLK